jgi:hypothetical protein
MMIKGMNIATLAKRAAAVLAFVMAVCYLAFAVKDAGPDACGLNYRVLIEPNGVARGTAEVAGYQNKGHITVAIPAEVTLDDGGTPKAYNIAAIGSSAFWGCTALETVTIAEGVKSIEDSAFWDCAALKSVTIPESVKTIGDHPFYGCISLESIVFTSGVTSIGNIAFYGCESLKEITFTGAMPLFRGKPFDGCSGLTLRIPEDDPTWISDAEIHKQFPRVFEKIARR